MSKTEKENVHSEEGDYDTRFEVVEPGFSEKQEEIHAKAIDALRKAIKKGDPWKKAASNLKVEDKHLKSVILDDFLKITLAERHFQGGEEIQTIAHALHVPAALLIAVKEDMIREVKEASIRAYHLSQPEEA